MAFLQRLSLLRILPCQSIHLINRNLSSLNESQYNTIADISLECLLDSIDNCQNRAIKLKEDMEVSLSQGVLKLEIGPKTWVINKQTPNRQLWWSSPISGPLRFEYNPASDEALLVSNTLTSKEKLQILKNWYCTRSGPDLYTRLRNEVLSAAQLDIEEI